MQAVPGPEPALELELEHEPEPEPELGPERPLVQPLSARGVWPAFRSGAYLRDPVTGHGPATLAFGLPLAAPLPAGVTKQRHEGSASWHATGGEALREFHANSASASLLGTQGERALLLRFEAEVGRVGVGPARTAGAGRAGASMRVS
jgi:hypothetical protein